MRSCKQQQPVAYDREREKAFCGEPVSGRDKQAIYLFSSWVGRCTTPQGFLLHSRDGLSMPAHHPRPDDKRHRAPSRLHFSRQNVARRVTFLSLYPLAWRCPDG